MMAQNEADDSEICKIQFYNVTQITIWSSA